MAIIKPLEVNKKKGKHDKWIMLLIAGVLLSSVFAVFSMRGGKEVEFNLTISFDPIMQTYSNNFKIPENLTVTEFLSNYIINTSFTEMGQLECIMDYCNNENKIWNLFINSLSSTNYNHTILEDESIFLVFE